MFRDDIGTDHGPTDLDSGDRRRPYVPGPVSVSGTTPPRGSLETLGVSGSEFTSLSSSPSKDQLDSCGAAQGPNLTPKPKLWSLAEIATSADRSTGSSDSSQSRGRSLLSHGPALPRHLYYSSPFMSEYSSFRPLGPLHGGSHLNGLQQKMLQQAEAATRDCRPRGQNHAELQRGLMKA